MVKEKELKIINDNLTIWRALNVINPEKYPEPLNDGKGISRISPVWNPNLIPHWEYFHNNWTYLMDAASVLKIDTTSFNMSNAFECVLELATENIKNF